MIPPQPRSIYRRAVHGLRTAATYDDLTFERIEANHFVHVQTVVIHEPGTDTATCTFIITTIGEDYPASRVAQADKDTGISRRAEFWMREGDILVARFYDGTNTDEIHAYVHGVEYAEEFEPQSGS